MGCLRIYGAKLQRNSIQPLEMKGIWAGAMMKDGD